MLTAEWLEEQVFGFQDADATFTLNWVCTMLTLRAFCILGKTAGVDVPLLSFDDSTWPTSSGPAYRLFSSLLRGSDERLQRCPSIA